MYYGKSKIMNSVIEFKKVESCNVGSGSDVHAVHLMDRLKALRAMPSIFCTEIRIQISDSGT